MTFAELFQLYFDRHAKLRIKRPDNVRYFYQRHGRYWAAVPVGQITRRQLQDWVEDTAVERGKEAANRAINQMAAIYAWGIRRGYIAVENPCCGVERFRSESRERFLLPSEIEKFKASLNTEGGLISDFFWLCLLTGARKGNVLTMRWDQIDTDLAIWRLPAESMKNNEPMCIALSVAALAVLQRCSQRSGAWVFPSRGRTGHLTDPKRAWKRICKRAELGDLRIHDLRRTVGSYLAMQGADGFLIAKALGHKDLRSTAVYARMNLEPVRVALANIQNKWLA